ncbi:MAG: putative metal-dependent hydrolase, partial [Opitutaceae bacterium]|nr:putative metal-dependent hydrolase [Cytophagales bacterium]
MTETELELLKYPIGKFVKPTIIDKTFIDNSIRAIESFPSKLEAEVIYLTDSQLDTSYRPEGWTIRQVVNHCADSHINSLVRFKLALTEDKPIIKPYYEERWAELSDSKSMPIIPAIQMLHGIHSRWTILLKSLSDNDIKKTFIHPEHGKEFS